MRGHLDAARMLDQKYDALENGVKIVVIGVRKSHDIRVIGIHLYNTFILDSESCRIARHNLVMVIRIEANRISRITDDIFNEKAAFRFL